MQILAKPISKGSTRSVQIHILLPTLLIYLDFTGMEGSEMVHGQCSFALLITRMALGYPLTSLDIVRAHQAKHLYESFKMTRLFVYREVISKSFKDEVLATWA